MRPHKHISKFLSVLFLLLISVPLFFSNSTSLRPSARVTAPAEKQESKERTLISADVSFDAIVNVGLQWEFTKAVYVIPQLQVFQPVVHTVDPPCQVISTALLPYFVNLFSACIVVNAP